MFTVAAAPTFPVADLSLRGAVPNTSGRPEMNDQVNRPGSSPMDRATELECPVCASAFLIERQCQRVCPNCGYTESGEDLFGPPDARRPPPSES